MSIEQWIDKIKNTYEIDIKEIPGNNQFIAKTLRFSDPCGKSLSFYIAFNSDNQPSLFSTDIFKGARFNIAEYYTAADFLDAADVVLSGRASLEKKRHVWQNAFKLRSR